MKAIKAILSFVVTVLKSKPVLTKSKNGFMIYQAIKPEQLAQLELLCEKAEWSCKNWPTVVNQKTGEVINDAHCWIGKQSAKKELSVDELMSQATEISAKD